MPKRNRIVITITDIDNEKARIECKPTFEELISISQRPDEFSNAVGYAMHMLLAARKRSKELGKESQVIKIPGIRRPS